MNKEISQSVFVNAESARIFDELLLWGQSVWWPRGSLMRFENLSGNIKEGTLYLQKVKLPFGPSWHTKNEAVSERELYIKRVFLDGLFEGFEELSVLKESASPRVVYSFHYKVKGLINRIVWKLLFRRLHIKNIEMILRALKDYLEKYG